MDGEANEKGKEILTPSYYGALCRHNGNNVNYEIACDECDFYLLCYPEFNSRIRPGE